jgi:hypothetical protein
MKTYFFKGAFIGIILFNTCLISCSDDNGTNHSGAKDNDNRGNHATDPALPSDAEYPGSKLNDSIHKNDSTHHR